MDPASFQVGSQIGTTTPQHYSCARNKSFELLKITVFIFIFFYITDQVFGPVYAPFDQSWKKKKIVFVCISCTKRLSKGSKISFGFRLWFPHVRCHRLSLEYCINMWNHISSFVLEIDQNYTSFFSFSLFSVEGVKVDSPHTYV